MMEFLILVISLVAIILSGASFYFSYKTYKKVNVVFDHNTDGKNLSELVQKYFNDVDEGLKSFDQIKNTLEILTKQNQSNLSVIETKRFNPYEETGGDLSFCVVIMDRLRNGIMITSLHSRERTRIYTRNIENGISNVELLFDEKETLDQALKKLKEKG